MSSTVIAISDFNPEGPQTAVLYPGDHQLVRESTLPVSSIRAFEWHAASGAFERLSPPWEAVRVISRTGGITDQGIVTLSVPIGPIRQTWVALHDECMWGHEFRDVQLKGAFSNFVHRHLFTALSQTSSQLRDEIHYDLPGGKLGEWLGKSYVEQKLSSAFAYRHRVTVSDLQQWRDLAEHGFSSQKILISGANGLVGKHLTPFLTTQGHRVARMLRRKASSKFSTGLPDVMWNPSAENLVSEGTLDGYDAVVHLAGENIAAARWTSSVQQQLRESRLQPTRRLCEELAKQPHPPKVLVCASAIGFYGDRGHEPLTEDSPRGDGFLAELCEDWEAACAPARDAGIRVVNVRIGLVLTPEGGALKQLLRPFQFGLGGKVGSGQQYWSWVTIHDLAGAILHAIARPSLSGPVNVTAPGAVTNAEFTATLAKVLHRPALMPLPEWGAKLALGEKMAEELLLSSSLVQPARLLQSGYQFRATELEDALRFLLGATDSPGEPGQATG